MEPLIKLRLLESQLNSNEFKRLMEAIGFDKIISFLYSYFHSEYNRNKTHDPELLNINKLISEIINDRDTTQFVPVNNNSKMQINDLPSVMIRKCASYLNTNDYMNFSKTNRAIYCASNSPIMVRELDIRSIKQYDISNLRRFKMIKTLCISTKYFKDLETGYETNFFPHLTKLHLDNMQNNYSFMNNFALFINTLSRLFNLNQITHLKLDSFGEEPNLQDFHTFYPFLISFSNVTHLELEEIHLTNFNRSITQIFPSLKVLKCADLGYNAAANKLRNIFMKKYSNQLITLEYDGTSAYNEHKCFPNVRALSIFCPSDDSLSECVNFITDLEKLELMYISNTETSRNAIIKAYKKFINMNVVSFVFDCKQLFNITSLMEMALINSKNLKRKSLMLLMRMRNRKNVDIKDIEFCIKGIMYKLSLANINDVMLKFYFRKKLDKNQYADQIITKLKQSYSSYLSKSNHEMSDNYYLIVVANTKCAIN
eukprot:526416_1